MSRQTEEYHVEPVRPGDEEKIMNLLRQTFFIDEPLNQAVGLCTSEPGSCPELEEYCTRSLLEGLSFKAVDREGNIIGVTISGVCPLVEDENGNDLLSKAQRCQNSKFQKIMYILARREEGSKLWEKFPQEEQLVELTIASTDSKWRRRRVMNVLVQETEKAAIARGVRLLRMDTSSAYSAMSAERLGFTCVYNVPYTDIKMDGRPLIVPEPPHVEDRVYIKTLFNRE